MPAGSFATALGAVASVEGWLTEAQAHRLWRAVASLEAPATVVEIGSFRGRSTIVLASAAAPGVAVVAIDPHAGNDRGPQELDGFEDEARADREAFRTNVAAAGVADKVRHVPRFSSEAHGEVDDRIDVLYIDGAHRYGPALDDIQRWGARVGEDGTMLIHDTFSSVGVTLAILRSLLLDRRFHYVGRTGSLAEYRRAGVGGGGVAGVGGVATNAARQLAQLPWFARNVAIKALLLARLRPLTRLLGHRGPDWPY